MPNEPQEVRAEVIEPVVNLAKAPEAIITYTLPTAKVDNLEAVEEYVSSVEKFFSDVKIDTTDPEQVKQLKGMRTAVKKIADAINGKRIAMDKDVKSSMSEADGALNSLRDRMNAVYAATGKQIEEADALWFQARTNVLLREYEGIAPDLVKLIPLDAFVAREKKLVQKSWTGTKACDTLDDMVAKAVAERETLEGLPYANEADMVYCRTLSMADAMAENARLAKAKEEADAHKAEAEDLARKVAERAECPAPEPAPVPLQSPLAEAMGRAEEAVKGAGPQVRGEPLFDWDMRFTATKSQAMKIRDYAKSVGAAGKGMKGTMVDG